MTAEKDIARRIAEAVWNDTTLGEDDLAIRQEIARRVERELAPLLARVAELEEQVDVLVRENVDLRKHVESARPLLEMLQTMEINEEWRNNQPYFPVGTNGRALLDALLAPEPAKRGGA